MMETPINNLKKIIADSSLDYTERVDFLLSLSKLDEDKQKIFVSLFRRDSFLISRFYQLLQKKKLAMEQKNHKLWQEIIDEEIELIKKLP